MSKFFIEGGRRLAGEIQMNGAKNSVLPILAASLITPQAIIHNCPDLSDVDAAKNILEYLGCRITQEKDTICVRSDDCRCYDIPDPLMHEMRSSVVFLGAILTKCSRARISMPGGCELGARPIDLHISSLRKLGVIIKEDHGYLDCSIPKPLQGCEITLPFPSVGATENILLTAVLAQGTTVVRNGAREPEITDLANFLNQCGADIHIIPDGTIYIEGVKSLHPCEHAVIPDRIATATYLCCAATTGGEISIHHTNPQHISAILPLLEESGCTVFTEKDRISLRAPQRLKAVGIVRTMPYPGFPTDAQSPIMSLMARSDGTTMFVENIFENRYKQVPELCKMGAKIQVEGRAAFVEGVKKLHSAKVECTDLRGGASLVVAALGAEGVTEVSKIKHIERGYENLDLVINSLGGRMIKQKD